MARGWESKEIESQIEAAQERSSRAAQAQFTLEQQQRERERESIQLSRTRVMQDLETATHPGYMEQLRRSLKFLDEKLAGLEGSEQGSRSRG